MLEKSQAKIRSREIASNNKYIEKVKGNKPSSQNTTIPIY